MIDYMITGLAITGLFVGIKSYGWACFIWSGTNFYWCLRGWQSGLIPQAAMFFAFFVSCVVIFFKKT